MKDKFIKYYMEVAKKTAELSYCNRNKVGAIIVKNDSIISIGYNGTLPGSDNTCEDEFNNTHDRVIHAEMNALMKLVKSNESCLEASMFCTLLPCVKCSIHIIQAGIKTVYYNELYRDTSAIQLLADNGIACIEVQ